MVQWIRGLAGEAQRGHLSAVRLMADGIWFAKATGINPPTLEERPAIRAAAQTPRESRSMKKWLFLVGAILSESAGSLSLKAALGHPPGTCSSSPDSLQHSCSSLSCFTKGSRWASHTGSGEHQASP